MRVSTRRSKDNSNKRNVREKRRKHCSVAEKEKIKIINNQITQVFDDLNLKQIAIDTGFLTRNSALTPFIFIYTLALLMCGRNYSLNLIAININELFCTNLTGSAFSFRMNSKKAVSFLRSCFESLLTTQLHLAFQNNFGAVFDSIFEGVILEDSTVIELNQSVKGLKGTGGVASKSAVKLNWVFNICAYAAIAVDIFAGSTPDRKNHKTSLRHLSRGTLLIRDLGYFVIESLLTIHNKGAYYLSRVYKGSFLYLNINDEEPLNIAIFFKKVTCGGYKSACVPIFVGKKDRFATQLVLQKVPKWVLKQRIKQYRKKNSGKLPSEEFVSWAGYSVFITNIPEDLLKSANKSFRDVVIQLYKVRWQIELLFKKFKSNLKLGFIKAKNKNRVLCQIYGKLISIILSLMVLSYAASKRHESREISLAKVMAWLISEGRLAKAIFNESLSDIYFELSKQFKHFCKDKRNRKTTLGMLEDVFLCKKLTA